MYLELSRRNKTDLKIWKMYALYHTANDGNYVPLVIQAMPNESMDINALLLAEEEQKF